MNERHRNVRLLAAFLLLVCTAVDGASATTLDAFVKRYHDMTSVSCAFADAHGLKGSVKAVRGGKYRIEMNDRTIVCNGAVVWSATPSSKTVIVNAYRANSMDLSVERVFFTLMNVYRPTVVQEAGAGKKAVIRLAPPSRETMVGSVQRVDVELDAAMKVTKLVVYEDAAVTTWMISKLVVNASVPAPTFTYTAPKGWQTIDLR